ncbi:MULTISPECIES: hypothetical protein [Pantoea]
MAPVVSEVMLTLVIIGAL